MQSLSKLLSDHLLQVPDAKVAATYGVEWYLKYTSVKFLWRLSTFLNPDVSSTYRLMGTRPPIWILSKMCSLTTKFV